MLSSLTGSSILLFLVRKLNNKYNYSSERLHEIYKNSLIYIITKRICDKIKICFRYSLLGVITEGNKNGNLIIIDNSKYIRYLRDIYVTFRGRIVSYSMESRVIKFFLALRNKFYSLPVRSGSAIIIIGILINTSVSLLSQNKLGLWGWFMRAVILSLGWNGLYSYISWEELSKTSYFVRSLNKSCKI